MRVYHFASRRWGLEDLRLRRLKIAEIEDLNDPFELRSLSSADRVDRRALDDTRSKLATNRGMLCFSSKWSNPVLWSHYADGHRGIAMGFDIPDESIARVRYRRDREPLDLAAMEREGAAEDQMHRLLTTKYSHWRYESEWRAFLTLEDRDSSGFCFAHFSDAIRLREVVVGAQSTVSRTELADALGDLAPRISTRKARLAFGSFQVVRQQKAVLWA